MTDVETLTLPAGAVDDLVAVLRAHELLMPLIRAETQDEREAVLASGETALALRLEIDFRR